jgi:hypothetical protein
VGSAVKYTIRLAARLAATVLAKITIVLHVTFIIIRDEKLLKKD